MRILILIGMLCLYTSTCFANMFGTRSINYWPVPEESLSAYAEHERNVDPKYRNDPDCAHAPYGLEIYKTYEYKDTRHNSYRRKFGADLYICGEGSYLDANGYSKNINNAYLYIESEDITKRKFGQLIPKKGFKNKYSQGTHWEWVVEWFEYTTTPKSQMSVKEQKNRAMAEAIYMHYKKKEFFGKEWLCAENTEEGIKIYTSNNDKEMF